MSENISHKGFDVHSSTFRLPLNGSPFKSSGRCYLSIHAITCKFANSFFIYGYVYTIVYCASLVYVVDGQSHLCFFRGCRVEFTLPSKQCNFQDLPIESCRTPTELMFDECPMEKGCVIPGYDEVPIWNKSCAKKMKQSRKWKCLFFVRFYATICSRLCALPEGIDL